MIINSEEMKTLRNQIKRNYKLYDTSDEIENYKKKSDLQIFMIEDSGFITFTITPK